jgi:hypothetical protein
MKNKIYVFGVICIFLILAGCMFKINHWPGGGILVVTGFALFVLVFMPQALLNSYRAETAEKPTALYLLAYLCILIVSAGMILKIQHWPGGSLVSIIGIPLPFILFLPAYLLHIRKNKQLNYMHLVLVLFFFAYFAAISVLLALNVSKNVLDESILSAYNYEQQTSMANRQTTAFLKNIPDSNATDRLAKETILKINTQSTKLYHLIENIKAGIIKNTDAENGHAIDANGNIDFWSVFGIDNKSISYNNIFRERASELEKNLTAYKTLLLTSIETRDKELADYINQAFVISSHWQWDNFEGKRMISIIETLNTIKSTIAFTELETVTCIGGNRNE